MHDDGVSSVQSGTRANSDFVKMLASRDSDDDGVDNDAASADSDTLSESTSMHSNRSVVRSRDRRQTLRVDDGNAGTADSDTQSESARMPSSRTIARGRGRRAARVITAVVNDDDGSTATTERGVRANSEFSRMLASRNPGRARARAAAGSSILTQVRCALCLLCFCKQAHAHKHAPSTYPLSFLSRVQGISAGEAGATYGERMRQYAVREGKTIPQVLADSSVQPKTLQVYQKRWELWLAFLRCEAGVTYENAKEEHVKAFFGRLVETSTDKGIGIIEKARAAIRYYYEMENRTNPAGGHVISRMVKGLKKIDAKDGAVIRGADPITKEELRCSINKLFAQSFSSMQALE